MQLGLQPAGVYVGVEFGCGSGGWHLGLLSGRRWRMYFRPSTLRLASMLDGNSPIFSTSQCDWRRTGRLVNNMAVTRSDDVTKMTLN